MPVAARQARGGLASGCIPALNAGACHRKENTGSLHRALTGDSRWREGRSARQGHQVPVQSFRRVPDRPKSIAASPSCLCSGASGCGDGDGFIGILSLCQDCFWRRQSHCFNLVDFVSHCHSRPKRSGGEGKPDLRYFHAAAPSHWIPFPRAKRPSPGMTALCRTPHPSLFFTVPSAACAAASRAIGTR